MKKKIYIEGMSCMHCVKRVRDALEEAGGKKLKVEVGFAEGMFKSENAAEEIKNALEASGYGLISIE